MMTTSNIMTAPSHEHVRKLTPTGKYVLGLIIDLGTVWDQLRAKKETVTNIVYVLKKVQSFCYTHRMYHTNSLAGDAVKQLQYGIVKDRKKLMDLLIEIRTQLAKV